MSLNKIKLKVVANLYYLLLSGNENKVYLTIIEEIQNFKNAAKFVFYSHINIYICVYINMHVIYIRYIL